MKLEGYRLMFGERRGAHELLLSAPEISDIAITLAALTDRPGHAGNVNWQPFFSGFPIGDFYVFAHTFPDTQAERAGMVLSEVLMFSITEVAKLPDLDNVRKLFSDTLDDVRQNESTKVSIETTALDADLQLSFDFPPALPAVLEFLLAGRDESKPVVWAGQSGFDDIIRALWGCLPPKLRTTFRFRLSFAPEDAANHNLTIVSTPGAFVNRFAGYQIASSESRSTDSQSLSISYLLKKSEGDSIKQIVDELDCDITNLPQLQLAEQCARYLEFLAADKLEFINHIAFLRRLSRLAPDAKQGSSLKTKVFSELTGRLHDEKSSEAIFALNNLDLAPFLGVSESFSDAITEWIRKNFFRLSADNLVKLLEKAISLEPLSSIWGKAIIAGLYFLKDDWSKKVAAQLWSLWSENTKLFDLTEGFLSIKTDAINDLTNTCPRKLSENLGNKLKSFAVNAKLYKLHAAVVSSYLEPIAAFNAQVEFETKANLKNSGFSILLERLPFDVFLAQALIQNNNELFKLIVAHTPQSSQLFKKIDLRQAAWQRLSVLSLEHDKLLFWKNIPDETKFVFEILDLLLVDHLKENSLIRFAAESDFADLTDYPQRASIWEKLSGKNLQLFLSKTAQGWLRRFAERSEDKAIGVLEDKLRNEILQQSEWHRAVAESRAPVSMFLRIFEFFPDLTDRNFSDELTFVLDQQDKISLFDANAIGKFVNERKWRKSADEIHRLLKTGRYNDLSPALEECRNLFYFWEFLFSSTLSRLKGFQYDWDDWFKAFTECLIDLYGSGPREKGIWDRAGGDMSVLLNNVTGREAWHSAIQELIKGHGGKKISTERIIEEAKRDFRRNETLERLEDYFYKLKNKE